MIEVILSFFGNYLIEFMTLMLGLALSMRWISFTHSKRDEAYFSHFTRELLSTINEDKTKNIQIGNTDEYLNGLLGRVNKKLPERNLRKDLKIRHQDRRKNEDSSHSISLKDYVSSKHGLIASIQSESNVFSSKVSPDFSQLTDRVMNDDENWTKVFGLFPVDGITRILDVLPTMFIILGVFGTFIGISLALPEIAQIDFNNLESSGDTLAQFVINVTFAMKTSIAGIFFSILLTLLNTFYPIDVTRERTFDKVENTLQVLWYHLQTDNHKSSTQGQLDEILQALKSIADSLAPQTKSKKAS